MANVNKNGYVFLVDDEPIQTEMLKDYLSDNQPFTYKVFSTGEEVLKNLHLQPRFIVLDYHLNSSNAGALNGIEILKQIKERQPNANVIMLSGQDKIDVAIESLKFGAKDYVIKGETAFNRLNNIISRLIEFDSIKRNNSRYKLLVNSIIGFYILFIAFALYQLMTENLGIRFGK